MSNIENFKNINEVFESCYGAWISTLFGDAEYWNDSNTYNKPFGTKLLGISIVHLSLDLPLAFECE
jgi:hypothetical protein